MSDTQVKSPTADGRLAMRIEGDVWRAYYALPGTMEGAVYLGEIKLSLCERNPAVKQAFMDIMRESVSDFLEDVTGIRPTWSGPEKAPEHERSGRKINEFGALSHVKKEGNG